MNVKNTNKFQSEKKQVFTLGVVPLDVVPSNVLLMKVFVHNHSNYTTLYLLVDGTESRQNRIRTKNSIKIKTKPFSIVKYDEIIDNT